MKPAFRIGDDVECYGILGKITSVSLLPKKLKTYQVTHVAGDGDARVTTFYDFEMTRVEASKLGFVSKNGA